MADTRWTPPVAAKSDPHERLLSTLQELGMSHQEAVVYCTLVSSGPSPAREVSRASGLAREHCYEVLRKLEARGLVKVELSDRSVYAPVEPRVGVNFFISSLELRFAALKDAAYEAGVLLEALSNRAPHQHKDHARTTPQIQLVFGKRVNLEFERWLESCKEEYMGVISPRSLAMPRGIQTLESLERTAKRDVRVRVLTWHQKDREYEEERLERFSRNLEIRKNAMAEDGLRFGLFDRLRAMQPMHGPSVIEEEREVICTRNPTVVNSLAQYFEHLWSNSSPLTRI